jgi:hypothetical protein
VELAGHHAHNIAGESAVKERSMADGIPVAEEEGLGGDLHFFTSDLPSGMLLLHLLH